jgi:hypothetical protein
VTSGRACGQGTPRVEKKSSKCAPSPLRSRSPGCEVLANAIRLFPLGHLGVSVRALHECAWSLVRWLRACDNPLISTLAMARLTNLQYTTQLHAFFSMCAAPCAACGTLESLSIHPYSATLVRTPLPLGMCAHVHVVLEGCLRGGRAIFLHLATVNMCDGA